MDASQSDTDEKRPFPKGLHHLWFNVYMSVIRLGDKYTGQVLLLTPRELVQLRDLLNSKTISDELKEALTNPDGSPKDEELVNSMAEDQKAITIYNAHSLPTIDREAFESNKNRIGEPFDLEITQRIKDENGNVIKTERVGVM